MDNKRVEVKSWLPIFSGFYNSVWDNESTTEYEGDYLLENGLTKSELEELSYLNCYSDGIREYHKSIVKNISDYVCDDLIKLNVLSAYEVEGLVSLKQYNYSSDSINITYYLTKDNISNIEKYLKDNSIAWDKFLKDNYTSYSGFIPSYDNDINSNDWTIDSIINSTHQLGKVYEFILTNDNQKDSCDLEYYYYDYIIGNICLSFGDVKTIRQELIDRDFYNDNIETLTELFESDNKDNKKFLNRLVNKENIITKRELKKKIDNYQFYDYLNKTNMQFDFVK